MWKTPLYESKSSISIYTDCNKMIECRYIYYFFLNQKIYVDCALHSQDKMQTKLIIVESFLFHKMLSLSSYPGIITSTQDDYAAFIHRRAKISRV